MHGREDGESRKRSRHMWSVAWRGSTATVGIDSSSSPVNSFLKDGRTITVGDCALFKPPNNSPPFVGFIRSLSLDKDNNLKLCVNWLYRPAEVVLGKGVALEAAPNEVFYSFHRDETLAASLLHPCKVAFLPKGVELPSGVSSFVCRRVYDITNKCLWWLTDKDYINDRQEEVDQLLQKSRFDMHPTIQHPSTISPKSANGTAAASPLKHSSDSIQSNGTNASHPKGKKRDLGDQTTEPVKRERLMKDSGDSVLSRSESCLKSELTKITDKGGLADYESVEQLVQLMQAEKSQKKVDFSCRSMLAGIIACTDRFDCLDQFVQLRGLPFLDEWLQEIHKGKVGDSSSPKDSDKSVEDFLFVLLRALDKLPVNLNALQMCNIGKSVNNLRSHKNLEIQKKARSLVDTWKKRVELEMNMNDTRPTSNQYAAWPGRSKPDASHGGNKHAIVSSDTVLKSSGQLGSTKSIALKPVHGDTIIRAASVPIASQKTAATMPLTTTNYKDGQARISSPGGGSELLHTALKEEKSSSSSQSHTNSQCSSDHARNIVFSGKEDARCSTAGSKSMNKTRNSSRHHKSAKSRQGTAHSGMLKDSGSSRNSSHPSIAPSEKFSESTTTSENNGAASAPESNSHKIIVKIPNTGRSLGQVANTARIEDPSAAHSEKFDQGDASLRGKNNGLQITEADMIPTPVSDGQPHTSSNIVRNVADASNGRFKSTEKDVNTMRSGDSSMSSMNALIESCVKYSEAPAPIPVGDDSGMNLLASVAAGEITRSGASSPECTPPRNTSVVNVAENASVDNDVATLCNDGGPSRPSISNEDQQQKLQNGKVDDFSGGTSASVSTAFIAGRSDEGKGDQIHAKAAVIKDESHEAVSCSKKIANSYSPAQDEAKDEIRCEESLNKDHEDLLIHTLSKSEVKTNPDKGQTSNNASVDRESPSLATQPGCAKKDEEQAGDSSSVRDEPVLEHSAKRMTETTHELQTCNSVSDGGNKRIKLEKTASFCPNGEEGSVLAAAGSEEKAECKSDILESKERVVESYLSSNKFSTSDVQVEGQDEHQACTAKASSSEAVVPDADKKLEFDLNEGLNMEDLKNGEPTTMGTAVFPANGSSLFGASQSAISSASNGLPASVTVASAAKRPFVPPEDLLRNKSELGWKGSAATSAFRPAEPRKVVENQTISNSALLKEPMASKSVRPFLDIDLNVTDEMVLEDTGFQDTAKEINHKPDCTSGGFQLDLNKVDDNPDFGHRLAGNFERFEVSVPPHQSSNSMVNGHSSNKRNFDLNDGPAADESTLESSPYNQHGRANIPPQPSFGMRMNNAAAGSLSSWYSPGTTYSAVRPPVPMPDMSILGTPGPHHRMLGGPTTASQFNADFYRGSVLTSSPAMSFATTPFQYPAVFPFGSSFPLPASSLAGGSAAYIDTSSGGRFCTPAVPTQLAASVSSQYLRPCVVSLPDVSSNGESSQKWVRQGLDLNSGPLGVDAEGKDEAILNASRQHPAVNSQTLMDEQARGYQVAAGVLKRKEPEGGWGTDRLSYKQSSWQ